MTQWRTSPVVIDLNGDGLNDLVMLDHDGYLAFFERRKVNGRLTLLPGERIFFAEEGTPSVFDHTNRPVSFDSNGDGLNDLASVDGDGYLWFLSRGETTPGKRVLRGKATAASQGLLPLRLNCGWAGPSGRRQLIIADWDGDGKLDLLVNSTNTDFLRNIAAEPGRYVFRNLGAVDTRVLAGHATRPTVVDWDRYGVPDLLVGAEDGFLYYLRNPRANSG